MLSHHPGFACRWNLPRGIASTRRLRSAPRTKSRAAAVLAARCDRLAVGPAKRPYGQCWRKAGRGGRCVLPCAPSAWWLLHLVTVGSGATGGHVETLVFSVRTCLDVACPLLEASHSCSVCNQSTPLGMCLRPRMHRLFALRCVARREGPGGEGARRRHKARSAGAQGGPWAQQGGGGVMPSC